MGVATERRPSQIEQTGQGRNGIVQKRTEVRRLPDFPLRGDGRPNNGDPEHAGNKANGDIQIDKGSTARLAPEVKGSSTGETVLFGDYDGVKKIMNIDGDLPAETSRVSSRLQSEGKTEVIKLFNRASDGEWGTGNFSIGVSEKLGIVTMVRSDPEEKGVFIHNLSNAAITEIKSGDNGNTFDIILPPILSPAKEKGKESTLISVSVIHVDGKNASVRQIDLTTPQEEDRDIELVKIASKLGSRKELVAEPGAESKYKRTVELNARSPFNH